MRKIALALLLLAAIAPAQTASFAAGPKIGCADRTWNFGSVPQDRELKHKFLIKNEGNALLELKQVIPTCACTAALPDKRRLAPGESTFVETTLKTGKLKGRISKTITVVSNDPGKRQLQLIVTGEILPPFYVKPSALQFGKFSKTNTSKPIPFTVVLTAGSVAKIETVRSSSNLLDVQQVGEPQKRADGSVALNYVATVKAGAPVGLLRERIDITSNVKNMRLNVVSVTADVAGEVQLSQANLNFGRCTKDEAKSREIMVLKSGAADLEIKSVDVTPKGRFETEIVTIEKGRKYKVKVTLKAGGKVGYLRGRVQINTNCPGENSVHAWFHAFVKRN